MRTYVAKRIPLMGIAVLLAGALALGACDDTGDVKLSAGNYKIEVDVESDGCGVLEGLDTDTFRLEVGETGLTITAYFVRANGTPDQTKMLGSMIDSVISASVTTTWTDDAMSPTCHTEFTKAILGQINTSTSAEFSYTWNEAIVDTEGDTCTAESLLWDANPCSSEATVTLIEKL